MAAAVERDIDRVSKWSHSRCSPSIRAARSLDRNQTTAGSIFSSAPRSQVLNTVVVRTRRDAATDAASGLHG
jgi:hypothetical protein